MVRSTDTWFGTMEKEVPIKVKVFLELNKFGLRIAVSRANEHSYRAGAKSDDYT